MTTGPARLSMLKKSLEEMSIEELREHVRGIRADRRISKDKPKAKKAAKRAEVKTTAGMTKLLAGMSKEEAAALLRELEGNDADGQGSTDQGDQS